MNIHDELPTAVPEQSAAGTLDIEIDLDDVEGHGLKEIVVGLSAAAVLGGSAASAAALTSSATGDLGQLKTPAAVMGVVGAVQDDVTSLTAPTVTKADQTTTKTAATATRLAGATADKAGDVVRTVDGMAADAITSAGSAVREIVDDPTGAVDKATAPAMTTTDTVAARALSEVAAVQGKATTAVGSTVASGTYLAGYALKVVDVVTDKATGTAMDVVLGLDATDLDAGAKGQAKDAWVVAKVGHEVVGSGQMDDGQVTVTIESRHHTTPITFTVGGNHDVAPITVHLSQ